MTVALADKLSGTATGLRLGGLLKQANLLLELIDLGLEFGDGITLTDAGFFNRGNQRLVLIELFGDTPGQTIGRHDIQISIVQSIAQAHQPRLAFANIFLE